MINVSVPGINCKIKLPRIVNDDRVVQLCTKWPRTVNLHFGSPHILTCFGHDSMVIKVFEKL